MHYTLFKYKYVYIYKEKIRERRMKHECRNNTQMCFTHERMIR